MKDEYRKEQQTDSYAPLSILAMSISLALSPDCGRSARSASHARASGVIAKSQNRNMRSAYTDVPIFLAQKNTKKIKNQKKKKPSLDVMASIVSRYMLSQTLYGILRLTSVILMPAYVPTE